MLLRFRDLGPLLVESDGAAVPVGGARLESALALLLINAGRPVAVDALAEAVWGDQGRQRSITTLDSHIWRLRQRLEPDRTAGQTATVLVRDPGGYRLAISADQADSTLFTSLAETAGKMLTAGEATAAVGVAEEALALWRGRPFGRNADDGWAAPAAARLEQIRGALRETYIGALLAVGAAARALAELEPLIAEEPLRERLWILRVVAYQRTGQRSAALQAYSDARTVLVDELGLEPGAELRALQTELLQEEEAASVESTVFSLPLFSLPAPRNRFIGRTTEMNRIRQRIGPGRLVTVVATAGCGKTRLVVELARQMADEFAGGACFVDLTAASPDRVLDTVTSTLGQPLGTGSADPRADLARLLRTRQLLLVLDNCEHVLDEVAELVDGVLNAATRSAIIATSREPLMVEGEDVVPLAPLAPTDAVELFLDRLDAWAAEGTHDKDSMATVRDIVDAVDGLPLALELAAGRSRAYTLSEIAAQVRADASTLSQVGRARGSHHHRTVFDAIDTSYRSLPVPLAELHRAVGVIPGPFTAQLAAGLIDQPPGAVADLIAGLVHRSLLSPLGPHQAGGVSRFAQFATVRGHAVHSATRLGTDAAVARDDWIERLVRARPPLGSTAHARWYRTLDDDLAALRATLQHTLVEAPTQAGVAIAGRLILFWAFNGMAVEGQGWMQVADRSPAAGTQADRALVHLGLGSEHLVRGRIAEGRRHIRAGIAQASGLTGRDAVLLAEELTAASGPLRVVGDEETLGELAAAVASLAQGQPALGLLVHYTRLAHDVLVAPSPDLIAPLIAVADEARVADRHHTGWSAAAGAARLLLTHGRPTEALPMAQEAVRASVRAGLRDNIYALELLGIALAQTGHNTAGLRVFGAVEARHGPTGRPWPPDQSVADLLTTLTTRLGREAAGRARSEGANATMSQLLKA